MLQPKVYVGKYYSLHYLSIKIKKHSCYRARLFAVQRQFVFTEFTDTLKLKFLS